MSFDNSLAIPNRCGWGFSRPGASWQEPTRWQTLLCVTRHQEACDRRDPLVLDPVQGSAPCFAFAGSGSDERR